jgi:molecular chaperone GrpE
LIFADADLISADDPMTSSRRSMRMMADENQTARDGENATPASPERANGANPTPPEGAPAPTPAGEAAAELKDRMLRALADAENTRRRAERDVADARQYGITSFAREMLQVGDNLRRALEAVPEDKRAGADPTWTALLEGVEVTERGLDQTLAKFGVKRIDAKGKKFDPSFHQAMFELPRDDVPPGTVVDELQAGYAIGDRVLKPALVVVSRRGPAAANDDQRGPAEAASGGIGSDRDGS